MSEIRLCDSTGLEYIEQGGERRYLAALPDTRKRTHLPLFADHFAILPESEWREFEDDDSDLPILDQDGQGSCVGHGSCSAFTHAWLQAGNRPLRFSPCYLYGQINGGRDQGAIVGDAMEALLNGICLEETVGPKVIFKRQFPPQADQEARRFRLEHTYRVRSFREAMSAVQLGFAVSFGVMIGRSFEPNGEGVLPRQSGSGGGHCMVLRRGARKISGAWYIKGQNSWGTSWGKQGRFWMEASYFEGESDHFAPQAAREDPDAPDKLPDVSPVS